ncbi:hypothetical protein PsorP6_011985 [Peronosclerospora sorghi]|uniref:Uncharacterized protein n=1 Tax=Peronosclerospora sorghi TaxID=230839 RepID=A0ACC0WNC6_9STRA|nr:hypothetical protein PsorP6_011985 [Peronosclerospora sorghi]
MELSPSMLKYTSLCILSVQNSLLAILMRLSRVGNVPHFNPATAIFVGEALKLVTCFEPQRRKRIRESFRAITYAGELLRASVPAMLYVVQNNLQYVAVSNLDAPTFQVINQLKILTTAIFSVLISGFAGVYYEKILKCAGSKTTLWERNVQICMLGLTLSGGGLVYNDFESIMTRGFLFGNRPAVWSAISFSAFGGLLEAVVIKYADNILKDFSTSIAKYSPS